jgi:hypothetical protein
MHRLLFNAGTYFPGPAAVVLFFAESSVCFLSFSCLCLLFVCGRFCLIRRSPASFPFPCFAGVVFTASGADLFFFAGVFLLVGLTVVVFDGFRSDLVDLVLVKA